MLNISSKKWTRIAIVFFVLIIFLFLYKFIFLKYNPRTTILLKTPFSDNLAIKQPLFNSKKCDILDYGAKAGDKKANSSAISQAIDNCSGAGGGTVIIPKGQWLVGPIKLKSNINLHIEKKAELIFSTDLEDYLPMVFSRFEGIEYYNYSPPIYANNCTNIAITGEGTINGQAEKLWWKMDESVYVDELYDMGHNNIPVSERLFGTPKTKIRPSFVQFVNCDTILVEDVHLINGPLWSTHFIYSQNITVNKITIDTGKEQDTDGIVLDSSNNVLVENADLTTGDDAIVIKSGRDQDGLRVNRPSENIVVRDCIIRKANAGIAIGSEISGGARNISVQNLSIKESDFAFRLKSAPGRGNVVENIWIDGISADKTKIDAIQIDNFYERPFDENHTEVTAFRNINISNVSVGKAEESSISIRGSKDKFITDLSLKNIDITSKNNPEIANVDNLIIDNLKILDAKNKTLMLDNIINAKISDYYCPDLTKKCIRISGEKSQSIEIKDIETLENSIVFDDVDKKILTK